MRSCLRSVLVEPRPSDAGDPEAGWFLRHAGGSAVIDQSVECIRQGAVVEPGAGGSLQILERHTSLAVLGIKGGQDLPKRRHSAVRLVVVPGVAFSLLARS